MTDSTKRFCQLSKKWLHEKAFLKPVAVADAGTGFLLTRLGVEVKRPVKISRQMADDWVKADFLTLVDGGYSLSAVGRAHLRRHMGGDYIAQHAVDAQAETEKQPRRLATTPLQWMRARGKHMAFCLNEMELQAGERLLADFRRSQFEPHQTMDWSRPVFVDGSLSNGGVPISDHALDAQKRLLAALAYIGPGLAELAVDVCCREVGLDAIEKKLTLPRRSAKIVLKLALMRLSVHYGYQSPKAAVASFRMR